jgi:hypothetical protein
MTDTGRIGLNEVELGIPVPKFWGLLMGRVTGAGVADKLCGFAQMCTPQRALQVGMLDEVASGGQLLQVRPPLHSAHHLSGVPIDVRHYCEGDFHTPNGVRIEGPLSLMAVPSVHHPQQLISCSAPFIEYTCEETMVPVAHDHVPLTAAAPLL